MPSEHFPVMGIDEEDDAETKLKLVAPTTVNRIVVARCHRPNKELRTGIAL
jgi:hypothetical protein